MTDTKQLAALLREGAQAALKAAHTPCEAYLSEQMEAAADELEAEGVEPVAYRHRISGDLRCPDYIHGVGRAVARFYEPLYTTPAPAVSDSEQALEHELSIMQSTISSYESPAEALKALIDWHVAVATDPRVGGKAPAVSVPDGWQLVPVEPTGKMLWDGFPMRSDPDAREDYAMLLKAAPQPESSRPLKEVVEDLERNPKFAAAIKDGRIWVKSATQPSEEG